MDKEKEIEELTRIFMEGYTLRKGGLDWIEETAKSIQQAGFRDVDKLREWLEEGIENKGIGMVIKSQGKDCFENQGNLTLGQISHIVKLAFKTVLDKLEEL